MINEKVTDPIYRNSGEIGTFGHGFTYSAHPVCAAVALETLKIYAERDIVADRLDGRIDYRSDVDRRLGIILRAAGGWNVKHDDAPAPVDLRRRQADARPDSMTMISRDGYGRTIYRCASLEQPSES